MPLSYQEQIGELLRLPQSVGLVGGRLHRSVYLVGIQGANILYLDPHIVQPVEVSLCPNSHNNSGDAPAIFSYRPRRLHTTSLSELDGSLAAGFYLATESDLNDLSDALRALGEAHPGSPILTLSNAASSSLGPVISSSAAWEASQGSATSDTEGGGEEDWTLL